MNTQTRGRWVSAAIAVLLAVTLVPAQAADFSVELLNTYYDSVSGRTTYSYILYADSEELVVNSSRLVLRNMGGVLNLGSANYWRAQGWTFSTGTWLYEREPSFRATSYTTFDVIADPDLSKPGIIEYWAEGDGDSSVGDVVGPVPKESGFSYRISGSVFMDANRNGVMDPGESTISGVTVELSNGTGTATDITNSGIYTGGGTVYIGNYLFSGLPNGVYDVTVPDEIVVGSDTLVPTGSSSQSVTISDASVSEVDFGFAPPLPFTVSGTIFTDLNRSGSWDEDDEPYLENVTVDLELVDTSNTVVGSATSVAYPINDGSGAYLGNYVFNDVPPGDYVVRAPQTAGLFGNLEITTPSAVAVTVTNAAVTGIDFGYLDPNYEAPPNEVVVDAYVFFDANRNGSFDGFEEPLVGVPVTLTNGSATTLSTDSGGHVSFGEQIEGSYLIEVSGDGPYGLSTYWTSSTGDSAAFSITADTTSPQTFYFGYYLRREEVEDPDVCGSNHTIGFWKHNVLSALSGVDHGVQVSAEDLLNYLTEVETLWFDEPFDLGPNKLSTAYWWLHPGWSGNTPIAKLHRQLLAAELNWVSGFNSSMPELEAMIYWYAEWIANENPDQAGSWAHVLDVWNNLGNTSPCPSLQAGGESDDGDACAPRKVRRTFRRSWPW